MRLFTSTFILGAYEKSELYEAVFSSAWSLSWEETTIYRFSQVSHKEETNKERSRNV